MEITNAGLQKGTRKIRAIYVLYTGCVFVYDKRVITSPTDYAILSFYTLLEKFGQITLYVTDDAVAKLYVT